MKLNILKWIYHLGYDRAQDRLYFGLKQEIMRYQHQNPTPYEHDELERFIMIIDAVFKPEQHVEVRVEDKFRV